MVVASRSGGAERIMSGSHTDMGEYINHKTSAVLHMITTPANAPTHAV